MFKDARIQGRIRTEGERGVDGARGVQERDEREGEHGRGHDGGGRVGGRRVDGGGGGDVGRAGRGRVSGAGGGSGGGRRGERGDGEVERDAGKDLGRDGVEGGRVHRGRMQRGGAGRGREGRAGGEEEEDKNDARRPTSSCAIERVLSLERAHPGPSHHAAVHMHPWTVPSAMCAPAVGKCTFHRVDTQFHTLLPARLHILIQPPYPAVPHFTQKPFVPALKHAQRDRRLGRQRRRGPALERVEVVE